MKTNQLRFTQALDFLTRVCAPANAGLAHPLEVANLLSDATNGADADLVVAGLLHDVLNDQDLSVAQLKRQFGTEVSQLVQAVSSQPPLPLANFSIRTRMLSIADQTAHLHTMLNTPQPWGDAEQGERLIHIKRSVDGMRGVSGYLEEKFDTAYSQAVSLLFFPPDMPRTLPRPALQMMPSRYAIG